MTVAGPLLAEDLDRPYEYRTFAVGDRVRVRLSPECRATPGPDSPQREMGEEGHPAILNGMIGTVVGVSQQIVAGHPLEVEFEEGYEYYGIVYGLHSFASAELEPLDPEATR